MTLRAIIIYLIALALIRYTGMCTFGIKSAFDIWVTIIFGTVLVRAIAGASPFLPTIIASFALLVVHKVIGAISVNNQAINPLVKGVPYSLYKMESRVIKIQEI